MRSLLAHLRAFWRGVRQPSRLDRDMNDEMRFHIEMEADRLRQRGLSPDEAARQAAIVFGGVEKHRGAGRDALGLTWTRGLSTDLKLGMRMLRKYPGLTAVALFALSLAIGAGAAYLEFVNDLMHGQLPFPDGSRIVGIQMWDRQSGDPERRVTTQFVEWRSSLRSFEDLAASRDLDRTMITDDGRAEPVRGVEITASAFRITRVPPLLGRPLIDDDERPGAPAVAVIGYDLWTTRFGSDPAVIGQSIRLGRARHTIVGVMPEGFGLPVAHNLWVPLSIESSAIGRREGPALKVFGKLAPGMAISTAQAELDASARNAAAEFPATDNYLNPVVKPYVESLWSAVEDATMQTIVFNSANIFFIGLLALCGANIATLVFARTATRETEISVRTALGASRARIAGQLFAEALVLSSIAAVIGLTVGVYALKWVRGVVEVGMEEPMMFWWNDDLSFTTIIYAAMLAVLAALIIGVVPAMKATGVRLQERLKQTTGATSGVLKFGGVWTGVIVTQVAVTVIFLAIVGVLGRSAYMSGGERARTFPVGEYLSTRLLLDRTPDEIAADDNGSQYRALMAKTYSELSSRLASEPGIATVTYGTRIPGMNFFYTGVEFDGVKDGAKNAQPTYIRTAQVATNYLDTFQARLISGRMFTEADLGRNVAIVDRAFVVHVLNGQEAVGRQIRDIGDENRPAGPWLDIVGVVSDLTEDVNKKATDATLVTPAAPDEIRPLYLAVHARTNIAAIKSRVRVIAGDVDPSLRLDEVQTLDKIGESERVSLEFFARMLTGVSIVAMVLAAAGVYALMSFTVSRRTAEIGIRVALGADPKGIVVATFSKAFAKIVIGILVGAVPAAAIAISLGPEVSPTAGTSVTVMTFAFATLTVMLITALACVVPARRALRIQPTDALKAE